MANIGEGATPLMYACQQSRERDVLDILAKKPRAVKERDRSLKTALHYCAENSSLGCAEAVLRIAPDLLDAQDEDGYTVLHLAVIAGNTSLLRLLISRGADVNILDNEKHSAVHWATVCGEQEALSMLVHVSANLSTADIHGGYPVHYAAQMCSPGPGTEACGVGGPGLGLTVLRALLEAGVDVNVQDRDGRQPILWAASAGSADAILALFHAGASVEAVDKDGLTALHCAASRGHTDCVDTLASLCGANVDHIDSNGCTALFYAVTLGHADATHALLKLGAEPNRQDRKGRTPAHCGAAKGQLETLRILDEHNANLWLRNVKGDFPLHDAVASGRRELVLWLLQQRAGSVNVANNDGRCPIHIAAVNGSAEMIKLLCDEQSLVNPIMRSSKGQLMTPLDAALHRGHRGCAKVLQLYGGVPYTKLTDTAASLKGTHAAQGDQSSQRGPEPTSSKDALQPGTGRFDAGDESPARRHKTQPGSSLSQGRMDDDRAIRHVERIDVPRRTDGGSSDEERSHKKRRRRRRSDHRKREFGSSDESSGSEEGKYDKDAKARPKKKSERRKDTDEDDRRCRRKKRDSSEEASSEEDRARRRNRRSHKTRKDENEDSSDEEYRKTKHRRKKQYSESGESDAETKREGAKKEKKKDEVDDEETQKVTEEPERESKAGVLEVEALVHENPPVTAADEEIAATLMKAAEEAHEEVVVLVENAIEEKSVEEEKAKASLEETSLGAESKEKESEKNAEVKEEEKITVEEEVETEDVEDVPNVEDQIVPHDVMVVGEEEEKVAEDPEESLTEQVMEEVVADTRRGVAEDEEMTEVLRVDSTIVLGEERVERTRGRKPKGKRSGRGKVSPGRGGTRSVRTPGRVLTMTESEERDELAARLGDVETVIKHVPLAELDGRSTSLGEESGGSTRNEDSSVLLDSGIEPSPRRSRSKSGRSKSPVEVETGRGADTTPGKTSRVPRLCRKGKNDDDDDDEVLQTISVTRTVQNTIRKYHLERRIFYQLLELKRLQIRAGRTNEQVLVKRLVDEYKKAAVIVGLKPYGGVYTFRHFERFLYDQLHVLQSSGHMLMPKLNPSDDIDTLAAILKKTRVQLVDEAPDNPRFCTHGTHRCHHAAHAYTGIPCAAYITKLNHHEMPKQRSSCFLPRIESLSESRPGSKRNPRPVTLELTHGTEKQARPAGSISKSRRDRDTNVRIMISLPTERLDRSKRYYVTFTIKGGGTGQEDAAVNKPDMLRHRHAKSF